MKHCVRSCFFVCNTVSGLESLSSNHLVEMCIDTFGLYGAVCHGNVLSSGRCICSRSKGILIVRFFLY